MEDIGYGLLDRAMIHQITERWRHGGIGIIVLQLRHVNAASLEAVQLWESQQTRLFWRYRMENDYFFFLNRMKSDRQMKLILDSAITSLKKGLQAAAAESSVDERAKPPFTIGTASASPSGLGRSAETMIYHALRDATLSMLRLRMKEDETELPFGSGQAGARSEWSSSVGIGILAKAIPTFDLHAQVSSLAKLFESNTHVQGAVIVNQGRPVGLVMKEKMHQMLAGQFGLPLYWNRSVEKIMDDDSLVVDASIPVEQVAQLAMARDISRLYDVVTITRNGKLLGAASIRSILECITNLRTEEARTANPLTGLPGNAAIQREMKQRIESRQPFAVIYADLDYFKWYNDCFGFAQGDALIRYTAAVLQDVTGILGGRGDFIGHIGGDDFIILTGSSAEDADKLCRNMIWRFDGGIKSFYNGEDVAHVVDRSGNRIEQNGVSVSLSLVYCDGSEDITTEHISQAAARLKKQAKQLNGSVHVMGEVFEKHLGEGRV
ncbi:GGDEF domain-containing protein [Paenibacillus oenotherae]|uniref:GGDEF domain-containing protein n=1 Tax=Paenibacillus oenotherae TaxID=1435645 RepID=A0ABS7D9V5_9BACL|nr:GGDEF domain-containing protein [Paenibacillus oenotherae]